MRTWCYQHPTVSFFASFAFYLFVVGGTVIQLEQGDWGWFVVGCIASTAAGTWTRAWWRRT